MKRLGFLLGFTIICALASAQSWTQYSTPEEAGWSSAQIEKAWEYADEIGSAAFMLIHDGTIVAHHGDISRRFMCHSVRKSLLSALYGIHVDEGTVDIHKSLGELGIDDVHVLNDLEKTAKISDLLKARSGVFHPAAYETEAMKRARPARGSHAPNTFWYYNNWDFNTLCAILMKHTETDFFEDFKARIGSPIGMEDYRLEDTYYHLEPENSSYPAYPFRLSARDLARIGQLFLQNGSWNGSQIISEDWVAESTTSYSENARAPGQGYAYMWWTGLYGNERANYSAQGVGNQAIIVFPEDNVVMVNRTDTYQGKHVNGRDLYNLTKMLWEARETEAVKRPELVDLEVVPIVPDRATIELSDSQLREYIGAYELQGAPVSVKLADGRLQIDTPFAGKYYMVPIGQDTFIAEDAWYIIQFPRNQEGTLESVIFMLR